MGTSRPMGGRRGTGNLPPIQRAGAGGSKFFSRPLPRISSRIRNFFYSQKDPSRIRTASRPLSGREVGWHPAGWTGGMYRVARTPTLYFPGGASNAHRCPPVRSLLLLGCTRTEHLAAPTPDYKLAPLDSETFAD
jgi:hypothetical protein